MSDSERAEGGRVRVDWIVVVTGALVLAVVAHASPYAIGPAIAAAYLLGRWDESYGARYRRDD